MTLVRHVRHDRDEGFTLIELLVVIIIIGILVAIAVPVFLKQRQKAVEASMKSDLRTVADDMESYEADYSVYPLTMAGVSVTNNTAIGNEVVHLSSGNSITLNFNASGDGYCLVANNTKAAKRWYYISTSGGLQSAGTTTCGTY